MLKRVDRIQMAVPDRTAAAANWQAILGAEEESQDRVACLGASRTTWRVGTGRVEFLEPDGTGPVADAVATKGAHLFAAGVSTPDVEALVNHVRSQNVNITVESGQAFLDADDTGGFGLRAVVSEDEALAAVGALDFFYETTLLVHDAPKCVRQCADLFALDMLNFVPISSDEYGYDGTLTLFRPNRLDRFEVISPNNPGNTMGRFFQRSGEGYYMAFAESGRLRAIEERVKEKDLGHTAVPPNRAPGRSADTVFLHPGTLGGMMLGISRPTMAWQWSGQPDKVEALP